jgi:hypothetical protein
VLVALVYDNAARRDGRYRAHRNGLGRAKRSFTVVVAGDDWPTRPIRPARRHPLGRRAANKREPRRPAQQDAISRVRRKGTLVDWFDERAPRLDGMVRSRAACKQALCRGANPATDPPVVAHLLNRRYDAQTPWSPNAILCAPRRARRTAGFKAILRRRHAPALAVAWQGDVLSARTGIDPSALLTLMS